MAILITVDDVKAIAPNLGATDAAIQLQIDIATCKLDPCLESNYADCEAVARAIKIYVVAHFSNQANRSGKVSSRKWADGSSEGYNTSEDSGTPYWDNALTLDTDGCMKKAYPDRKIFTVTGSLYNRKSCPK